MIALCLNLFDLDLFSASLFLSLPIFALFFRFFRFFNFGGTPTPPFHGFGLSFERKVQPPV